MNGKPLPFYVRPLYEKDRDAVKKMDEDSGFEVSQWLEDNTDYAFGIFNINNLLVGYCTIGGADDVCHIIKSHKNHNPYSLLLSDVYVSNEFRHQHVGSQLINTAIQLRWAGEKRREAVYLTARSPYVENFYQKNGFRKIDKYGSMVLLPSVQKDEVLYGEGM